MKMKQLVKSRGEEFYEVPELDVIEISVEFGFAGSLDGDTDDWEDGGSIDA